MILIVKYKDDRGLEILRGINMVEDKNGEVLIDGERYLKKDIARIEVVWR